MLLVLLACAHLSPAGAPAASPAAAAATAAGAPSTSGETHVCTCPPERPAFPPAVPPSDPALATLLARAAASGDVAWQRLARLTDDVGARPTGSAAYDAAVRWGLAEFAADGVAARAEPVTQPSWIRGAQSLTLTAPRALPMAILTLGGSVGTTAPIEAPVVVLRSFDELGPHVRGSIVLFNKPMEEGTPTIDRYGPAVAYRARGAARAAEHGAVATLVRSVTTRSLYTPHTGGTGYTEGGPRIPAVAVTPEDADLMERLYRRGVPLRARLEVGARPGPDVESAQVVAEIRGSERPDEIVLLGAHLDSWDVGQGAHDDGAGVVEVIEAMRLIAALGTPPRRTIRGVLYANEEFGLSGGKAYAAAHGHEPHVVAMETDLGGGAPLGWGAAGTEAQRQWLRAAVAPLGLPVHDGGGGADISTLEPFGTLLVGLRPDDTHYFDVHHTHADTVDKVDPDALRAAVGAVAGFAWLTANAPDAPVPVPQANP